MMKSLKSSHKPSFKRFLCFDLKFTKDLPIFPESQTCGFEHRNKEIHTMTEMKKHIYDETNGLWYELMED